MQATTTTARTPAVWFALTNLPCVDPDGGTNSKRMRRVYNGTAEDREKLKAAIKDYPTAKIIRCESRSQARTVVSRNGVGALYGVKDVPASDLGTIVTEEFQDKPTAPPHDAPVPARGATMAEYDAWFAASYGFTAEQVKELDAILDARGTGGYENRHATPGFQTCKILGIKYMRDKAPRTREGEGCWFMVSEQWVKDNPTAIIRRHPVTQTEPHAYRIGLKEAKDRIEDRMERRSLRLLMDKIRNMCRTDGGTGYQVVMGRGSSYASMADWFSKRTGPGPEPTRWDVDALAALGFIEYQNTDEFRLTRAGWDHPELAHDHTYQRVDADDTGRVWWRCSLCHHTKVEDNGTRRAR